MNWEPMHRDDRLLEYSADRLMVRTRVTGGVYLSQQSIFVKTTTTKNKENMKRVNFILNCWLKSLQEILTKSF